MLIATSFSFAWASYLFWFDGTTAYPIDYRVFWDAARAADIYRPSAMPFLYPPTALLLFKPLALVGFHTGYAIWSAVSALAFVIAVARLTNPKTAGWSMLSLAAIQCLVLGQSPMILAALTFAAFALPGVACGALLGLVMAIKPQLLLLAPLAFIVRREWRILIGMAGGAVAAVALSVAFFGTLLWQDWVSAIVSYGRDTPYIGSFAMPPVAGAILSAVAVILVARRVEGVYLIGLICVASLVASPYGHAHDMIAAIPVCVLLLRGGSRVLALVALLVFAGQPLLASGAMIAVLLMLSLASVGANLGWCSPFSFYERGKADVGTV